VLDEACNARRWPSADQSVMIVPGVVLLIPSFGRRKIAAYVRPNARTRACRDPAKRKPRSGREVESRGTEGAAPGAAVASCARKAAASYLPATVSYRIMEAAKVAAASQLAVGVPFFGEFA
jgi:hypothetical protein